MTIELVGLDGDDTLWHSEQLFVHTQARFARLLEPYVASMPAAELDERLLAVERRNLPIFGYGVKGFTLALIETAIEITGGAVDGHDIQAIIDFGKEMMDHPVEVLPGVVETLDELAAADLRLVVITKGDLLHQETKLARSGLAERFWAVEIVSEKDIPTYRRILERHGIEPGSFLMVGNSVRSDVLPVIELGGHAVHVPHEVTWELEVVAPDDGHRFPVLSSIRELPAIVEELGGAAAPAR